MLQEQFVNNASVHVSQAEIAAVVPVGELLVIEAKQMKDRGVKSWCETGDSAACIPSSSVVPCVKPRLTPPPANHIENP